MRLDAGLIDHDAQHRTDRGQPRPFITPAYPLRLIIAQSGDVTITDLRRRGFSSVCSTLPSLDLASTEVGNGVRYLRKQAILSATRDWASWTSDSSFRVDSGSPPCEKLQQLRSYSQQVPISIPMFLVVRSIGIVYQQVS